MGHRKHQHAKRNSLHVLEPSAARISLALLRDIPPWDWPFDMANLLLQTLTNNHADPSDRITAADLAGSLVVMNDELANALLGIVSSTDQPEQLRAKAAIALGPVLEESLTADFDDPFDTPAITETTLRRIQPTLHGIYQDESVPTFVRRRILEGAVRSPEDWHREAVSRAWSSGNSDWMLTAVFAMRWVDGFDAQILEALHSRDPKLEYEAVRAAGNWEIDAAWSHIAALVRSRDTPKPLLLAAMGAVGEIRPDTARDLLLNLTDSPDQEIAEAAGEAILMATAGAEFIDDEDEDEADG